MEGRYVNVTVISAADLKKVGFLGKMHTYAAAWIDPHFRQRTPVDEHGGTQPAWSQQLSFPVPEHFFQQPGGAHLHIEIYSKAALSSDKLLGAASIPLLEISQKPNQEAESAHQLHRRSGKPKGSVRLLIKVGEKTTFGAATAPPASTYFDAGYKQYEDAGAAYPDASYKQYNSAGGAAYAYPSAGVPAAAPYGYPPSAPPPSYAQPAAYGQPYYQQPPYYQVPPQPAYYQAPQPHRRRQGGGGMGFGTGLLAGAVGGLIVGDLVGDAFDGGCDGGGFF